MASGSAVVVGLDRVFGFAGFGGGGGDAQLVLLKADLDGAGALVGKLRDALDGRLEVRGADGDALVVLLGKHRLIVGELAGELARGEQTGAETEEESGLVFGKLHKFDLRGVEQREQLDHCLARDQGLQLACNVEGKALLR